MNEEELLAAANEMTLHLRQTYRGDELIDSVEIKSRWIELELLSRGIGLDYFAPSQPDPFASRFDPERGVHVIGDEEDEPGLKFSLARTLGEVVMQQSMSNAFSPTPLTTKKRQPSLFPEDARLFIAENPIVYFEEPTERINTYAGALVCPEPELRRRFKSELDTCRRLHSQSPNSNFQELYAEGIAAQIISEYVVPAACAQQAARRLIKTSLQIRA
jgi:hypothetical protein